MEKTVQKYVKMFRSALLRKGIPDPEGLTQAYSKKLTELYGSQRYREHDIYPTINTPLVYAVIGMCLILKGAGLSKEKIIDTVNDVFRVRKGLFYGLERFVDLFPFSWSLARKWNQGDHDARVKDGSVTYESFTLEPDRITYKICGCRYVEMFADYGIRELCKIFCMTDTMAYANLTRHVQFLRHSDLSDGDSCWDEIRKK